MVTFRISEMWRVSWSQSVEYPGDLKRHACAFACTFFLIIEQALSFTEKPILSYSSVVLRKVTPILTVFECTIQWHEAHSRAHVRPRTGPFVLQNGSSVPTDHARPCPTRSAPEASVLLSVSTSNCSLRPFVVTSRPHTGGQAGCGPALHSAGGVVGQ